MIIIQLPEFFSRSVGNISLAHKLKLSVNINQTHKPKNRHSVALTPETETRHL